MTLNAERYNNILVSMIIPLNFIYKEAYANDGLVNISDLPEVSVHDKGLNITINDGNLIVTTTIGCLKIEHDEDVHLINLESECEIQLEIKYGNLPQIKMEIDECC